MRAQSSTALRGPPRPVRPLPRPAPARSQGPGRASPSSRPHTGRTAAPPLSSKGGREPGARRSPPPPQEQRELTAFLHPITPWTRRRASARPQDGPSGEGSKLPEPNMAPWGKHPLRSPGTAGNPLTSNPDPRWPPPPPLCQKPSARTQDGRRQLHRQRRRRDTCPNPRWQPPLAVRLARGSRDGGGGVDRVPAEA